MNIPYVDLKARNARQRAELMRAIGEVVSSGASCSGNAIDTFEHALAEACGTTHAVAVGSGTEALWFALLAHGIGRGDEVITVPMTSSSTLEAILLVGARPVFADIDPHTYTMDPEAFARAVGTRTKAVIPSHLFGQMAEIDPILAIAHESGISVIEDASDALGADDHGRRAGSLGHCGCFGFHPENNPGALGHAGAVVTNDAAVAARIRSWCDQGHNGTNRHRRPEWTGGMDAIQAAVPAVRLRHCDKDHARRRSHASIYRQSLAGRQPATLRPQPQRHPCGRGKSAVRRQALRRHLRQPERLVTSRNRRTPWTNHQGGLMAALFVWRHYAQNRLQALGKNSTSSANSSSLPSNINQPRNTCDAGVRWPKLSIGPTASSPGPMFETDASTALAQVSSETFAPASSTDMTKVESTMIIRYIAIKNTVRARASESSVLPFTLRLKTTLGRNARTIS
ncbi:MAG: hypothetical protein FJ385_03790 [Verrucomicrobia bacterium]|nr:hypothetical protein [Verrucomicrobiota bacterium]